jgi:uncharacterized protein YybS (DUF2232 family)
VPDKSVYSWQNIGVAVAGGLAAAAVFAVLTKGTGSGLLLAQLAPLPLMIVALGFGIGHGATAALIATAVLTIWPHYTFGIFYALAVALPAFLASYAVSGAPWRRRDLLERRRAAFACAAVAIVLAAGALGLLGYFAATLGGVEEALNPIRARAFMMLDEALRAKELPEGVNATELSGVVSRTTPAVFAAYLLLLHTLNLWGAAQLAKVSGLLPQAPQSDTAEEFMLPRAIAGVFVAGVLAASFGTGFLSVGGLIVAFVFGLALAFQGLAVVHYLLRDKQYSVVALSILYFVLGVLGWPVVLLTALGVVDVLFDFRHRDAAPSAPDAKR